MAALDRYWGNLCRTYSEDDLVRVAVLSLEPEVDLTNLEAYRVESLESWISAVTQALPQEDAA
jgi:hypothetical protein